MYNSIYPAYVKSYYGLNNIPINRKQDEEKSSHSSQNAENNTNEQRHQAKNNAYFPNGEKTAIDYTKHQIGIEQVLADFKNTTNAIGAPDEIKQEVSSYLSLVESQSEKENPNKQIIQSNLKNASQILDEYITNTLKKPSKVVENWVDALFLQQIDYKSSKKETPADTETSVKPEITTNYNRQEPETNAVETSSKENGIYVPDDPLLKRMFIQAKKYAAIENNEKALYEFQNTIEYSNEIGDIYTSAMAHYEQGKLYDGFNRVEDALYNYNEAAKLSNDNNIKAKAHLSMGRIYDDYVKFEPAVNHYSAAVSFAGEADNLKLQTGALSDLARIHTERYDKNNAYMFMDMASVIAEETQNNKVKGIISSRSARMCEKLGDNAKALKLYGNSAESYTNINDNENLAANYRSAADIMFQYGNSAKAKKLLFKAYIAAQNTDNAELKMQITQELANL
ncbi:MAG: hypothetical protein LUH11_00860 [Candidatus Gastranaerophilales bacterium]|nr:hypothetical protein [Candidatus Gastranaerophilales bacterium]